MKTFNTGIIVDNKILRLTFDRIKTKFRDKYFVCAMTDDAQTTSFDMIFGSDGKWIVAAPVPNWIKALEPQLIQAVTQFASFPIIYK
jgi:hypothetical protein